jgi:hypothetical protein
MTTFSILFRDSEIGYAIFPIVQYNRRDMGIFFDGKRGVKLLLNKTRKQSKFIILAI